jgi:hypothetical protein
VGSSGSLNWWVLNGNHVVILPQNSTVFILGIIREVFLHADFPKNRVKADGIPIANVLVLNKYPSTAGSRMTSNYWSAISKLGGWTSWFTMLVLLASVPVEGSILLDGSKVVGKNVLSTSSEIDTDWRRTKHGWQNIKTWHAENTPVPQKSWERIHPLTWATIVFLAVMSTVIWASNEEQVARLFSAGDENGNEVAPALASPMSADFRDDAHLSATGAER